MFFRDRYKRFLDFFQLIDIIHINRYNTQKRYTFVINNGKIINNFSIKYF